MKLQAFDSSYFHAKTFSGDDCFQNIFFLLFSLELNKDKGTDYVIGWKSNSLFESKLFHYMVLSYLT